MANTSTYSKPDNLNDRQWLFCLEYVKDLNATQAAIRAGYSEDSARDIGCENLTKPDIAEAIAQIAKGRHAKIGLTGEYVLQTALDWVSLDIGEAFDEDGCLKAMSEIPINLRRAMTGQVAVQELYEGVGENRRKIGYMKKVTFVDRVKALDLLGRNMALWIEREIERGGEEFAFEGDIGARLSENPDLTRAFLADLFGKTKQTANGSSNGPKPAKNGHGAN